MATTVTSPQPNTTVHSTFAASGPTSASAISGEMIYNNGTPVKGTGHVTGKEFSVSFQGLTPEPDNKWVLNIYENGTCSLPVAVAVTGLTVIR